LAKPWTRAMASPGRRNTSVRIAAVWMPRRSKIVPSATLAALHDPQSPTPVTMTSELLTNSATMSSGAGLENVGLLRTVTDASA